MSNPMVDRAILNVMNDGVVTPYYLESHASYVKYESIQSGATVETDVATVLASLEQHAAEAITADQVNGIVDTAVAEAVNGIVGGASDAYNTLKEIETWVTEHEDLYTQLVNAIAKKVDKVEGKGLSTEDFTTELKAKLTAIDVTNGNFALSAQQVAKLDSIDTTTGTKCVSEQQIALWDRHTTISCGTTAPADMKNGDMFLKIVKA